MKHGLLVDIWKARLVTTSSSTNQELNGIPLKKCSNSCVDVLARGVTECKFDIHS